MYIEKISITNFKSFKDKFTLQLNKNINIIVGDNEAGKSTIIDALHLALSGFHRGRYVRNELTQYLFNDEIVDEYISNLKNGTNAPIPPKITIEVFISEYPEFLGDDNSEKNGAKSGFQFIVEFDEKYSEEYSQIVTRENINTIPIEYYKYYWKSFSRDHNITTRSIPVKSALIDSSKYKNKSGSDIYISHIVKDYLEPSEIIDVSQSYRQMKESFMEEGSIKNINTKIQKATKISDKKVELSVELSAMNAWENSLVTTLDKIPFQHIGQGEQSIVKTNLALNTDKTKMSNIIMIEEPENHLSYSKLNILMSSIYEQCDSKQLLISTHSNFVVNKLGLDNLILLSNKVTSRLNCLTPETQDFFKKLTGYSTLRMILSTKSILVEGDSDELIVKKAYLEKFGKLPIENGIDVISVGVSFLRFLEIADKLTLNVTVITDNDGDIDSLEKKYEDYLGANSKENIKILYDKVIDSGDLVIGKRQKKFNYNTLEPKVLKANSIDILNEIFETDYTDIDDLHKYMKNNKTQCALDIFESESNISFPDYILEAIE